MQLSAFEFDCDWNCLFSRRLFSLCPALRSRILMPHWYALLSSISFWCCQFLTFHTALWSCFQSLILWCSHWFCFDALITLKFTRHIGNSILWRTFRLTRHLQCSNLTTFRFPWCFTCPTSLPISDWWGNLHLRTYQQAAGWSVLYVGQKSGGMQRGVWVSEFKTVSRRQAALGDSQVNTMAYSHRPCEEFGKCLWCRGVHSGAVVSNFNTVSSRQSGEIHDNWMIYHHRPCEEPRFEF